ncbi:hypothetical protein FTO74_01390 [Granulicella sp. WH15]|uniref:hypothetical protein n=1 Tax=Granulicella sp. WH15 TaxID=2602070 RepID=UPI0013677796|nr:hypothetical protein [Granulicella sp. WH15]QHN02182.1 hypothetical protein FTO74_01390 [Granulicella sp. WH15]
MPTASTIPLILLVMVLWRYTKGNILAIVLFTSIFEAASAINIGTLGVPTWLFALMMCGAVKLLRGFKPLSITPGINRLSLHLMVCFIVYTVWTGMLHPFIFHGAPVMHDSAPMPLAWSKFNFAQICYLLAAGVIYMLAVTSTREELDLAVTWYVRGCITASFFAVYQLANGIAHIPYPDIVLYSNPSHVIYHAYQINGLWRLNSTFPEASEMATFLTVGIGLMGWRLVTRPLRASALFYFTLMLGALLLTQSSLGYASLAFILAAGGALTVRYLFGQGGISLAKLLLVVTLAGGTVGLFVTTNAGAMVNKVINSVLLEKKNSVSYRERTETHVAALETMEKTFYMGAGWGSIRASGLTYMLLGTVGVPGFILFTGFFLSLFAPLLQKGRASERNDLFEQSLFALTIMILGLGVAGSEPVQPILWALFGVASAARPVPLRTSRRRAINNAIRTTRPQPQWQRPTRMTRPSTQPLLMRPVRPSTIRPIKGDMAYDA